MKKLWEKHGDIYEIYLSALKENNYIFDDVDKGEKSILNPWFRFGGQGPHFLYGKDFEYFNCPTIDFWKWKNESNGLVVIIFDK